MQASGPVKRGGKAFGTRDRVVECLLAQGDFRDTAGMASPRLAQAVGYPGSSIAFAQLLSGMERAGLITREVRGKRTYRVHLTAAGRERARHLLAAGSGPGRTPEPAQSAWRSRSGRPSLPGHVPAGEAPAAPARAADTRDAHTRGAVPAVGGGDAAIGDPGSRDYDELAHRLLEQVARRLLSPPPGAETGAADGAGVAAAAGRRQRTPAAAPEVATRRLDALEEKVAALERELARAKAARSELQAENDDLRDQMARIRDNLERSQAQLMPRRQPAPTGRLDQAEIALLQRLLADRAEDEETGRASTA